MDEYQGYYENRDDNGGYYQPSEQPPRRRGIGGYIVTSLVSMMVGALIATLYIQTTDDRLAQRPQFPPIERSEPEETSEPAQAPAPTPKPTQRPAASYDGMAPSITDTTNPIIEIVEQISPGVVGVNGYEYSLKFGRDTIAGLGSGIVVSSEGYIITNAHVIANTSKLSVTLSDGTEVDAEYIGADKTTDIAVLKIDRAGLTPLKLGNSDACRVGEFVIAIGDPTGRELAGSTTFGIISATARTVNVEGTSNAYIQTDAAINPGSSGGALINMAGEVIGVTSAKTTTADYDEFGNAISAEGLGFAIPINDAIEVAGQLITKGYVERPGLGISVVTVDDEAAADYDIPAGVLVYSINVNSPAQKAGLRVDDIIVKMDGTQVSDQDELISALQRKRIGDTVVLTVWREGEYSDISVLLGNLNDMSDEVAGNEYSDLLE